MATDHKPIVEKKWFNFHDGVLTETKEPVSGCTNVLFTIVSGMPIKAELFMLKLTKVRAGE